MNEIDILKARIDKLEQFLQAFDFNNRYIFQRDIQMLDGRAIQFARGTGTKIATTSDQKFAFHGATPVIQASSISAPNTPGGTYSQADATSAVTAINAIRTVLKDKGLTA